MATESIFALHTSAANIYLAVWNTSGLVFDFSSNTFKALGSASVPTKVMTEIANVGGVSYSGYITTIDLALLNASTTVETFVVIVYARTGGSPSIQLDTYVARRDLEVVSSVLAARLSSATAVWEAIQTITLSANPTPNTIEEALLSAILECRGKQSRSGVSFVKFRLDGSTIHAVLTLDDADNPSARTPQG